MVSDSISKSTRLNTSPTRSPLPTCPHSPGFPSLSQLGPSPKSTSDLNRTPGPPSLLFTWCLAGVELLSPDLKTRNRQSLTVPLSLPPPVPLRQSIIVEGSSGDRRPLPETSDYFPSSHPTGGTDGVERSKMDKVVEGRRSSGEVPVQESLTNPVFRGLLRVTRKKWETTIYIKNNKTFYTILIIVLIFGNMLRVIPSPPTTTGSTKTCNVTYGP